MVYGLFESAVNYVKGCIRTTFSMTPYNGKIEKSLYKAIEHSVFFLCGYITFWNRDWLYDLSMVWDYEFEISVYIYYYFYFVRFIVQVLHLDKKDKDYKIFLTHHIMTLALLLSSFYRYTRFGVIIALSHDISDIFLNFAKVMNKVYDISNDIRHNTLSNISLSFFVVSWIPTRIILNYRILNEIYTHKNMSINVFFRECWIDEQVSILLLILNFGLQVFWQILIIKFVVNIFGNSLPQDEKGVKYKVS